MGALQNGTQCRSEGKETETRYSRSRVPQGGRARKAAVLSFIHHRIGTDGYCRSIRECRLRSPQIRAQIPCFPPTAGEPKRKPTRVVCQCDVVVGPPVAHMTCRYLHSALCLFLSPQSCSSYPSSPSCARPGPQSLTARRVKERKGLLDVELILICRAA